LPTSQPKVLEYSIGGVSTIAALAIIFKVVKCLKKRNTIPPIQPQQQVEPRNVDLVGVDIVDEDGEGIQPGQPQQRVESEYDEPIDLVGVDVVEEDDEGVYFWVGEPSFSRKEGEPVDRNVTFY